LPELNSTYWSSVVNEFKKNPDNLLWRQYSDAINNKFFSQWLSSTMTKRLMKTDLFDEAVSSGLIPILEKKSMQVYGMDLSSQTVRAAKNRYKNFHGVVSDVRNLPFDKEVFDVVVSNSTLDHFETVNDIYISLKELYRVLCRGGKLLITLDNIENPVIHLRNSLAIQSIQTFNPAPYYVGQTLDRKQMSTMLNEIGFEVKELTVIMHFPRVIAVALTKLFQKSQNQKIQARLLRLFMLFEKIRQTPILHRTGYFLAAMAIKPTANTISSKR